MTAMSTAITRQIVRYRNHWYDPDWRLLQQGTKIIEIGAVEVVNAFTGNKFHVYL